MGVILFDDITLLQYDLVKLSNDGMWFVPLNLFVKTKFFMEGA